jgi:hypothetical protein
MSQTDTVFADFTKDRLNGFAGKKEELVKAVVAIPMSLDMALTVFTAYQLYQVNGLGLLDDYKCGYTTVSKNTLENDEFAGTAAIATMPFTGKVLTTLWHWIPIDDKGNKVSDYKTATFGRLGILDYDGNKHIVDSRATKAGKDFVVQEYRIYPKVYASAPDMWDLIIDLESQSL